MARKVASNLNLKSLFSSLLAKFDGDETNINNFLNAYEELNEWHSGFLQQVHNIFDNIFRKKHNKIEINSNSDLNIYENKIEFELENEKEYKESEDKGDYKSDYENKEDDYKSKDEGDYESYYKSKSEVNYESNYESEDYKSEDESDCESKNESSYELQYDDRDEIIGDSQEVELSSYVIIDFVDVKQNIQILYIRQYKCEALKVCYPLCTQALDDIKRPKSICCLCYEKLGDISKGLEFLGNWLIDILQTQNEKIKNQILIVLTSALIPFASFPFNKTFIESNLIHTNPDTINTTTFASTNCSTFNNNEKLILTQPPNLFMIEMLFIEFFKKMNDRENFLKINDLKEFGCIIGNKL
ncbi:hypothetical protein RclHR1_07760014 [Rhizophagus clarus]|uniref:Uncharacterized protein n=1 Tax=Rhizophagus clarus TaxID=94130 RepID=A0A2Z6SM19_9GLOM|nr:hypothetical protein RclHR1_07760014 [Rhizophagus clarus]